MSKLTPIVPVYREESKHHFVDPAVYEPTDVDQEGDVFKTSFLKVNNAVSLLGISVTDQGLASGRYDLTDGIDSRAVISKLLLSNGKIVDTTTNPCSPFVFKSARNYRELHLNMQGRIPGGGTYHVLGSLNLQTGTLEVNATKLADEVQVIGFELTANRINENIPA